MGITEIALNRGLSQYVQFKAGMFEEVLRYTALSKEELKNCKERMGKDDKIIPWDDKDGHHEIVLNEQFLKGLGSICLSLYMDLFNAGEKRLAERIVERSIKEAEQASQG